MKKLSSLAALFLLLPLFGCSTTQEVMLAKISPTQQITTVAQVPEEGNSQEMNDNLDKALAAQGVTVKAPLPSGTRKSSGVDAIVSYTDVWRWDLTMYLQSISIRLYDAQTGDLLASGNWHDSAMHGFRDAKKVVSTLVDQIFAKVRHAGGEAPADNKQAAVNTSDK